MYIEWNATIIKSVNKYTHVLARAHIALEGWVNDGSRKHPPHVMHKSRPRLQRLSWVSHIFSSYLLIQKEGEKTPTRLLFLTQKRYRGTPEVQRRLPGMKSFASGANRRLLFISGVYRFAVVIFGDAEGRSKEFLMGLWCEKKGVTCSVWRALLILNEHISLPALVQLDISTFPPPATLERGL